MDKHEILTKWVQSNIEKLYWKKDEKGKPENIEVNVEEFGEIVDNLIEYFRVIRILNYIFNKRGMRREASNGRMEKRMYKTIEITETKKPPKLEIIYIKKLVDVGLLKNGQKLYFSPEPRKKYEKEYAIIDYNLEPTKFGEKNHNLILYDGTKGSPSYLAKILIKKHGSKGLNEPQGTIYWKTEDGNTLDELNDKARRMGL